MIRPVGGCHVGLVPVDPGNDTDPGNFDILFTNINHQVLVKDFQSLGGCRALRTEDEPVKVSNAECCLEATMVHFRNTLIHVHFLALGHHLHVCHTKQVEWIFTIDFYC
jgi:hypothetical protein